MSVLCSRADCTPKCKSAGHCSELNTVLSAAVPEPAALAWLARHCHNPGKAKDRVGRSLVHLATSTGKLQVLQWLLTYKDGQLNGKDSESGYSPLHRAMFHGQLRTVVFLIKTGANLALADHDGMTALDHAVLDRPLHVSYERHALLDAYVWGTNSNYNLGHGSNTTKMSPDLLEQFRRDGTNISKVDLQKFHSAFVTKSGSVLTCGHGRGGRLGHGSETMQLVPRPVQLSSACTDVALGVDHSVFLTEGGVVHTCGMNTFHQLGLHPPPSLLLAPAPITPRGTAKHPPALGVAAARFHSLFWTTDSVYTWGLNAGQLGHMRGEKTVIQPKLVASLAGKENKIHMVVVSDGASVVLTAKGDVVALYEYGSKKLGQRQHNIAKLAVSGGNLDSLAGPGLGDTSDDIDFKLVAGGGASLKVVLLSITGKISVWEENRENNFIPCLFSLSREVIVSDIALHKGGMLVISRSGEAWDGTHQSHNRRPQSPTSPRGGGSAPPVTDLIKLKRIQHIHRAVAAACDAKGKNFCILQVCPNEALTEVPEIAPSDMIKNMRTLLDDANEFDELHDVICVVGNQKYAAHSFVLASGAETFSKQLRFAELASPTIIEIDDIHPDIFKQVLQFLYYKTCDLFKEGPCTIGPIAIVDKPGEAVQDILEVNGNPKEVSAFSVYNENKNRKKKNSKNKNEKEPVKKTKPSNPLLLLQEASKSLGIFGISKVLDCYRIEEGRIVKKSSPPWVKLDFCSKNFDELQDVTIICEDDKEIYTHKCILTNRSEYFFSMFNSGWTESCSSLSLPLPAITVQTVVDYLYRDDSAQVNKSEDIEFVCNILVVADQFLLSRLKQICECQLTKLFTLKNVAEILQFSFNYSAGQLQNSAMQFICLNLPALLENRTLEILDDEVFSSLDKFYRNSNPTFGKRRITPIYGFPSKQQIEEEYEADPFTYEDLEAAEEVAKLTLKSRSRRHSSGDKKSDRRSPKGRLNSTDSCSSGSDNEEDNDDKLSLCDFEIEEKDEVTSPPQINSPVEAKSDKSFFSSLLNQTAVETENNPKVEKKKIPKLSQKERKRLSMEAENPKPKTEVVTSPKTSWVGWGAGNSNKISSSPSLADILKMERKSPPDIKTIPKTPSSEVMRTRKVSESDKKSEKRTSWKKIDLNSSIEKPKTATPTRTSNPWKIPTSPPNNNSISFSSLESPQKWTDESFQQIMKEDVKKKENLYKAQSKPLYVTQIEEQAIEELKAFYNADNCTEEVITVSRVETGAIAAPVWRKFK
eukprot:TRINITY_DN16703_c0_g1_i1.p1 TRINITY_DN16703_c0_g1~~TRINITY_DN16703_c0_g1_i1.p1  ORF type:complete len:1265 (-),score=475.87 TRINITY_DN16703_c0_g1_i1:242-4036(-)